MNIFYLDKDQAIAARYHVNRHVVKMIQEYAQLLSTAHRVLDGKLTTATIPAGLHRNLQMLGWREKEKAQALLLPGESLEIAEDNSGWVIKGKQTMLATHINHPSTVWVRSSKFHYQWLYEMLVQLSLEKERRHPGGPNETFLKYGEFLSHSPMNIPDLPFTDPPAAMPARHKVYNDNKMIDIIASYRRFYVAEKYKFAKWTTRQIPEWYLKEMPHAWADWDVEKLKELESRKILNNSSIRLHHVQRYFPQLYDKLTAKT